MKPIKLFLEPESERNKLRGVAVLEPDFTGELILKFPDQLLGGQPGLLAEGTNK